MEVGKTVGGNTDSSGISHLETGYCRRGQELKPEGAVREQEGPGEMDIKKQEKRTLLDRVIPHTYLQISKMNTKKCLSALGT